MGRLALAVVLLSACTTSQATAAFPGRSRVVPASG